MHTLLQKEKWLTKTPNLAPGTLVPVKNKNSYPGADGICRAAAVKTSKGVLRKSVPKLCRLPIDQ